MKQEARAKQLREQRQKQYLAQPERPAEIEEREREGDPFKDFEIDLKRIASDEAQIYIRMGRNATSSLISLQYRTDWTFDNKTNGVKLYSLTLDEQGKQYIRAQFKIDNVSLKELIECY